MASNRQDLDEVGERSDFPIVCETCLGPNPYVRMQRVEHGGACHISNRPYTVFRWRPGSEARYKKTIICQEVAKAKNVCQVCLLDLDYGLPVQVRDQAMGLQDEQLPDSDVGKEFQLQKMSEEGILESSFTKERPNELLQKLQRSTPYYKRNRAQICSFFVRGECKRGAECPYRHELPVTGDLADQNIKDRYYGVNDPVAHKMMERAAKLDKLAPPEDKSITTLYVGAVPEGASEEDVKDRFYSFGEVQAVKMVPARSCAFVTFTTREAAERAAEELGSQPTIRGQKCRLLWGKPQEKRPEPGGVDGASVSGGGAGVSMVPPQLQRGAGYGAGVAPAGPDFFGLQSGAAAYYPSMDSSQMGSQLQQDGKRGADGGGGDGPAKRVRGGPGGGQGGEQGRGQGGMPAAGYGGGPPAQGYGGGPPGAGHTVVQQQQQHYGHAVQQQHYGYAPVAMPPPMVPGYHHHHPMGGYAPPAMAPPVMAPLPRPMAPRGVPPPRPPQSLPPPQLAPLPKKPQEAAPVEAQKAS